MLHHLEVNPGCHNYVIPIVDLFIVNYIYQGVVYIGIMDTRALLFDLHWPLNKILWRVYLPSVSAN